MKYEGVDRTMRPQVGSNNTGELCGMVEALLYAAASLLGSVVEIRYDSEYAFKVARFIVWASLNLTFAGYCRAFHFIVCEAQVDCRPPEITS